MGERVSMRDYDRQVELRHEALRERNEAREIVAKANNTVIGSYGYFTSPSFVDVIDKLKDTSNRHWNEKQEAEAKLSRVTAIVEKMKVYALSTKGHWIVELDAALKGD